MKFFRPILFEIETAVLGSKPFLQVLVGPRQVGKSTVADQIIERSKWESHFAAADSPLSLGPEWIEMHWEIARKKFSGDTPILLVIDEVQKVTGWSEVVKRLWDDDGRSGFPVRPLLLGSSALLLERGLTESLAGRFMLHRFTHWSFPECGKAFGWDLERWIYFGGYPGAASLIDREDVWRRYIADSLIEPVIAKDILQLQTVRKPALLRNLFLLAAAYPAQILSFNKMLGQLHDAGNTVTLAHYLHLLEAAFLVSGLEQFSKDLRRGSSPKLILWNNALVTGLANCSFESAQRNPSLWGHLVENAVGAHLLNGLQGPSWRIQYYRKGDDEVDFVVSRGSEVWALEVKSGRGRRVSGLSAFRKLLPKSRTLVIGSSGIPLRDFFEYPAEHWL